MRNKLHAEKIEDARKANLGKSEALRLAREAKEIYSCKGTKVVHLEPAREKITDSQLLETLLGPTGNLRAPTMKVGNKLLVGFNEEVFKEVFQPAQAAR